MCAARAYIMHMIWVVLMPDANGDSVHLMYLPLLADLSTARLYSWGSAVLATLYRELCRETKPSVKDIGKCLILLQSWALYRMPFLASVSHQPYLYPLPLRWTTHLGIGKSCDVPIYCLRIEQHAREGNDRLRRIPQTVMATDLQPSLEYTQWYYSCGKPYLLGGQSTVIPPYV
ncbi:hypothetical protein Gotur_030275 [Gossypium turneri]